MYLRLLTLLFILSFYHTSLYDDTECEKKELRLVQYDRLYKGLDVAARSDCTLGMLEV